MRLFVRTNSCVIITLQVEPNDTIYNVKKKLQQEGFPPDQQALFFADTQLKNDLSLSDYNLKKDSTIQLIFTLKISMIIKLKTLRGKSIKLEVKSSDKIENVKQIIQEKEGIPSNQQILEFGDVQLEDENILNDYNIQNEDMICLKLRSTSYEYEIIVNAVGCEDESLRLTTKTIESIKRKISNIRNKFWQRIVLKYNGEKLLNCNTLASYNINKDTVLVLTYYSDEIIVLRTLFSTITTTDRYLLSFVKYFKETLEKSEGIPKDEIRLMYDGYVLEDNTSLYEYNLEANSEISLIPSLTAILFDDFNFNFIDEICDVPVRCQRVSVIFNEDSLSSYFETRSMIRLTANIYKEKGKVIYRQSNVLHKSNNTLNVNISSKLDYNTRYFIEIEVKSQSSSEIYNLDIATFYTESKEGRVSLIMSRPGIGMTIALEDFPRIAALQTMKTLRDEYFRLFSDWEPVVLRCNRMPVFRLFLPDVGQVDIISDSMVQQLTDRDMISVIMPEDVILSNKEILDTFICPITTTLMEDPVICTDGSTYERSAITRWLRGSKRSPTTNLVLENKTLIPNIALRHLIKEYQRSQAIR